MFNVRSKWFHFFALGMSSYWENKLRLLYICSCCFNIQQTHAINHGSALPGYRSVVERGGRWIILCISPLLLLRSILLKRKW